MTNYIAIIIGSNEQKNLKNFFAKLKSDTQNKNSFYQYLISYFKYQFVEHYDFHVSYLIIEDIYWESSNQEACNKLCQYADKEQLSYFTLNFNNRTNEVIKSNNEEREFYHIAVETLINVHREITIVDRCRKSLKEWVLDQFDLTTLADIVNHGAVSGWSGITYYSETIALYDKYHSDIWEMLYDDTKDMGYKSIFELLSTFRQSDVADDAQFKNLLVWYAIEKIAFDITQGEYPSENDEENNFDDSDELILTGKD